MRPERWRRLASIALIIVGACGPGLTLHLASEVTNGDGGSLAEGAGELDGGFDSGSPDRQLDQPMASDGASEPPGDVIVEISEDDTQTHAEAAPAQGPETDVVAGDLTGAEDTISEAGHVSSDATGEPNDADAEMSEAAPPAHCSASQTFGPPALVPGLNAASGSVVSARFSPDELTAYLGMFHGANVDIFVATRGTRSDPFREPVPLSTVNSPYEDDFASVTANGLTLYFQSTRSGRYGLYVSTRTFSSDVFATPVELKELETGAEGDPYVVPNGMALYYHSYRNGNFDIYRAARAVATFAPPERLSIDTAADETNPVVSADELTIYFERPGNTLGQIWMARRSSISKAFDGPVSLSDLKAPVAIVAPTWVSPDECRLYLQAEDNSGGFWVYVAERKFDRTVTD